MSSNANFEPTFGSSNTPNSSGATAAPQGICAERSPETDAARARMRTEMAEQRTHEDGGQQERRSREDGFGEKRRQQARTQPAQYGGLEHFGASHAQHAKQAGRGKRS